MTARSPSKVRKATLATVLAAAMVASAAAAGAGEAEGTRAEDVTGLSTLVNWQARSDEPDRLARILETGEAVLAVRADAPPFSSVSSDDEDRAAGYSVDLCNAVVDALSREARQEISTRHVVVTAAERFEALRGGRADMLCGATTVTLDRPLAEAIDFSLLTFITGGGYIFNRRVPDRFDEMDPTKIGAIEGTTAADGLARAAKSGALDGESPRAYPDYAAAAAALRSGEIDLLLGDRILLQRLIEDPSNRLNGDDFSVSTRYLSYEPYALAIPANQPRLKRVVDGTLAHLYRSGSIEALVNRHFHVREMPPRLTTMFKILSIP